MPFSLGILVLTNEGKGDEVIYVRVVGGILWSFPFFPLLFALLGRVRFVDLEEEKRGMKKKK